MGRTMTALIFLFFLVEPSRSSKTVLMDRLAEGKAPTLQIEDSLVFEHIRNLYLFHSRKAFDHCVFDQATLVYEGDSNSTNFTWQPLRPGHYYFSTRDISRRSCQEGEKVPIRVITNPDLLSPTSDVLPPTPAPTAGEDLPAFPTPGWKSSTSNSMSPSLAPEGFPLQPGEGFPSSSAPAPVSVVSGSGIPFISSNPAVPIPTGETDTATIRPLPTPGDETQVAGLGCSTQRIDTAVLVACIVMAALGLWL